MSVSKEQPQFNMSAVFTSHRGFDDQLGSTGHGVTISPPVPASLTPEIDTVVDDVMKWVKNADADSEEEEEEEERDRERNPPLNVNDHVVNNGVDRPLHDSFAMGDPPSLLPSVDRFGRTASSPLFSTPSSSSVIGLGLGGQSISRPTPSRLGATPETTDINGDSLSFHFGASSASLSPPSNAGTLGSSPLGVDGMGIFSPALVSQMDSKPNYPPLGSGFSLTPPPSSEAHPFGSPGSMSFNLSLSSSSPLASQSSSPSSVSPSSVGSASSPKVQLLFNHQQPQPQLQPQLPSQPQLQPPSSQPQVVPSPLQPPIQPQPQIQSQSKLLPPQTQPQQQQQQPHVQPPQMHSHHSGNQTHFVGTAAVFVPKSMMAPTGPAPEAASSAPGSMQYPFHKEFNSYNHPGMYSGVPSMPNESHGDVSFSSQNVSGGAYSVESSSPQQPSTGMNGNNYRTKGCWYFLQTGHCQKGERCNFSHDRIPGMEIAPPVPSGNMPGMYMQPMPPYGYGVPPDVPTMVGSPRTMAKSNPYVVPPSGTQPQAPPPQQVVQPPQQQTSSANFVAVQQLYRTKPCRFFFEKGTCLKGDRCNFSHDPAYAAAYAAANPTSGFQMPDMSRFTNTTNGSSNSGTNGTVSNNGSGNSPNPNGTNGNGVLRNGGGPNRHQPSTSSGSSLLTATNSSSRLSSASEVDFPPLG